MNQNNISAAELFLRVRELLMLPDLEPQTRNKMMHDTLILCCHEGVKDTKQAFGNLFSQVDYLCKAHGIKVADKIAIQTMRRHSNSQEPLSERRSEIRCTCPRPLHLCRIRSGCSPRTDRSHSTYQPPLPEGTGNQQPPHPLHREELGQRFHPCGYRPGC